MRTRLGVLSILLGLAILGTSSWLIGSERVRIGDGTASTVAASGQERSDPTTATPSPLPSLRPCPQGDLWPRVPITAEWQQLAVTYFAAESLTVVSVQPEAIVVDVAQFPEGQYRCRDAVTGEQGAFRGVVPLGATAAVRIRVTLDNDDITKSSATVTLASWGNGWSVVDVESGIALSLAFPTEG